MDDKKKKPEEQVPVTTQEETPVEPSEETTQTPEPEAMKPIPTQEPKSEETVTEETKTTEAPTEVKPTTEETQPATEAKPEEKPSDEAPAPEAEPTPEEPEKPTPEDDQPVAEEAAQPAKEDAIPTTEPAEKEETNEPRPEDDQPLAEAEEPATDSEPEEKVEEAKTEEETTEDADTVKDDTASETPAPTPTPRDESGARWYVVHTYSGHENKVAATLKQRIESEHLEKKIVDILVPMQDKIEIRGGKKVEMKEKIFPGYILVKMILDDTTWLAVRTTQGVTSFVGFGNKPTPISDEEVKTIVQFTQIAQPTFKQVFSVDDTVKIVDGPFAEFIGKIDSVDEEKGKVRVLVSIFGRETPVELDFLQVQKI